MLVLPCAALQLQSRRAALGAFSGVALTPLVASADDGDDKPNLAKLIGKAAGGTGDGTPIGFPNSGYAGQSSKSIGEAFSARVINVGTTTCADVQWWMREQIITRRLAPGFHPRCRPRDRR